MMEKTSPFSSAIININVKGATLHVHQALVEHASKLFARFEGEPGGFIPGPPTADLKTVSIEVGHVLVQYLYSSTYQLRERSNAEKEAAASSSLQCAEDLKIAFGVYSLAREYDLPGLEVLAREQVSLLGWKTDVFTFIDAIEEAYPRTIGAHDAWLEEYIKTRMKVAVKDDHKKFHVKATTDETETVVQEEEEEAQNVPISKLLAKGMLEACRDVVRETPEIAVYVTPRANRKNRERITAEDVSEVPDSTLAVGTSSTEVPAIPAEKGHASPNGDDWVFPSPNMKEEEIITVEEPSPEPEPLIPELPESDDPWGVPAMSKKDRKKKKVKEVTVVEEPAPEPVLEPELSVPEAKNDGDLWGNWGAPSKKDKKKKKRVKEVTVVEEPVPDPVPEPAPEPEAPVAAAIIEDILGLGASKKDKKKKKGKISWDSFDQPVEPEPEPLPVAQPEEPAPPELEPEPEPVVTPAPMDEDEVRLQALFELLMKRYNKGKGGSGKEPGSVEEALSK